MIILNDKYNKDNKNISIDITNLSPLKQNELVFSSLNDLTDIQIFLYYPEYIVINEAENIFYSLYDFVINNRLLFKYNLLTVYNILDSPLYDVLYKESKSILKKESYYNLIVKILIDNFQLQPPFGFNLNSIILEYKRYYNTLRELVKKEALYKVSTKKYNQYLYQYTDGDKSASITRKQSTKSLHFIIPEQFYSKDKYKYNILNLNLNLKLSDSINIIKIFKQYPLNETIQFMYINDSESGPKMKIHSSLDKALAKSWLFNENTTVIKKTNSLFFKFKFENKYISSYINSNGELTLNGSFSISDSKNKTDILSFLSTEFETFIKTLKNYNKIYPKDNLILHVSHISFHFYVNANFPLYKLILLVEKHPNFKYSPSNNKFNIKLKYKDINTILVNLTEFLDKIHFSIQVQNLNSFSSLNKLMEAIGDLFISAKENQSQASKNKKSKMFMDLIDKKYLIQKSIQRKTKANIKILKEKGIINKAINCQKDRQPKLKSGDSSIVNSKIFQYKGNNYICPNKKYPFIGLTITKDLCCFKKNQKNKPIFKQFFNKSKVDQSIRDVNKLDELFKKHIVQTDKLLDWGRLGTISKNNILSKFNYYRIGNYNDYYSFINCINLLTRNNIMINDLVKLNNKYLFNSFSQNLSQHLNYNEYQSLIKNTEATGEILRHNDIIDLIKLIVKCNIIICEGNNVEWYYSNYSYKVLIIIRYSLGGEYEGVIKSKTDFLFDISDKVVTSLLQKINMKNEYLTPNFLYHNILHNYKSIQLVTNNNKTKYIYTQSYGILPVVLSNYAFSLSSNKNEIDSINNDKYYISFSSQLTKLNDFIKKHPNLSNDYKPEFILVKPFTKIVNGIKLKNGFNIPVKNSLLDTKKSNLKVLEEYVIPELDNYILHETELIDERKTFMIKYMYLHELFFQLKFKISLKISKDSVERITKIIKSNITISSKFNKLKAEIESIGDGVVKLSDKLLNYTENIPLNRYNCYNVFCDKNDKLILTNELYKFYINRITNEIINGNKSILSKGILFEIRDQNNYIKRNSEAFIISLQKIKKFFD
jgi:hypothetical protein